ncbi:MAG: serine hydrolase, partial [Verrucomicrobia bacterium]|nr:serine hydrolase [Verrucomicrobiota bacterium]
MSLAYFGAPATTSAQLANESIEAAHAYSAKRGGIGLIVKEGGQTRFERYAKGHAADEPIHIYSGTKSFFGALAVIAEKEGILSLDEKVAETLPEWRDDPRKAQITIHELLDFTSGLETGFEEIYGRSTADKLTLSLGLDAKTDPGDSFIYGPSHLQVFCEVMRRKLKRKGISYQAYLERKLIDPLGIQISQWRADSHGNVIPSAGIYMSGRHWMTFGEMVCRGGEWNGKQIVPADELTKCFKPTPINPAFG